MKSVPDADLEEEGKKLARRIALVDSQLLAMNKLAINRTYEIMGKKSAQDAALDLDAIAHLSAVCNEFAEMAREKGLK